jgi:hypothetical protein
MYRQISHRSDLGAIFVSEVVNLLIDIQLLPKVAQFSPCRYMRRIFADFNKVSQKLASPISAEVEPIY